MMEGCYGWRTLYSKRILLRFLKVKKIYDNSRDNEERRIRCEKRIKTADFSNCTALEDIHKIERWINLHALDIRNCPNIKNTWVVGTLKHLKKLEIDNIDDAGAIWLSHPRTTGLSFTFGTVPTYDFDTESTYATPQWVTHPRERWLKVVESKYEH